MTDIPYRIIRSQRKTISLEISPSGNLLVRCPQQMSQKAIDAFLESKRSWIESHRTPRLNAPKLPPLTMEEMDAVYELPYERTWHPSYAKAGGVPAIEEVKFSLVSNRGCFGACSFCALTFHQGRIIQVRSHESILREAELIVKDKDFKG